MFALSLVSGVAVAQAGPSRPLQVNDLNLIRNVADPQCSPDGKEVAYVVSSIDVKKDDRESHIWVASYDGTNDRQWTSGTHSESSPSWSPNGKYLAFLSSRPGPASGNQVWLMNRNGGEAVQLTAVEGSLHSFVWSPDSKKLALVIEDPSSEMVYKRAHGGKEEPPHPTVITRYLFSEDRVGYLTDRRTHIYIFDLATKKLALLTSLQYDQSNPVWSPDSQRIAFFSKHSAEPGRDLTTQLFVIDAVPGAIAKAITPKFLIPEGFGGNSAAWSPDGRWIAFLDSPPSNSPKVHMYVTARPAIVSADGSSAPRLVNASFDRASSDPQFSADGKSIIVTVTDDRSQYPASFNIDTGTETRLLQPPIVAGGFGGGFTSAGGCEADVVSYPDKPGEVYAVSGGQLRQLSHQNDQLFSELELGKVSGVSFTSSDGTKVDGILTLPVGYVAGTRVPFLLRIHGGPTGQNSYSFSFEDQIFAAHGYAVLNVNYRGSSGRGHAFAEAIAANWGDLEEKDLTAGVNWAIKSGVADPNRMGVGGWSYGCISTDYEIASDPRFKAATCGAGTGFTVALYGVDEYINQYNYEIGHPWDPKAWATYQKIAYPFLHANRIHTPTLYLDGMLDMNVPDVGNKEMYEALRTQHVPTELVLYPGQWHGIMRPSFQRDLYHRYLDWYAKYVLGENVQEPTAQQLTGN